jgi:hypothetical protein
LISSAAADDLAKPLASQEHELYAWSGWADCVAGEPQPLDLGVGENAARFRSALHAGAGRATSRRAAQPVEELGQVPVRVRDRPVVGDALDQLDDAATLDVVDNPAAPNRQRDATKT